MVIMCKKLKISYFLCVFKIIYVSNEWIHKLIFHAIKSHLNSIPTKLQASKSSIFWNKSFFSNENFNVILLKHYFFN